jgi:hypothetical protein
MVLRLKKGHAGGLPALSLAYGTIRKSAGARPSKLGRLLKPQEVM